MAVGKPIAEKIAELLAPAVSAMGYEWVGLEYIPQRGNAVLRIYIDAAAGITVDDCAAVSHQVSGVLDVEEPLQERYTLEVSSPGADRLLFTREHYERFLGHKVNLRVVFPIDGRRKFSGVIKALGADNIVLEEDGKEFEIALAQVDKARLVPEVSMKSKGS